MLTNRRISVLVLVGICGAALLAGCSLDPRTSNQGGGSLLSAATKLLNHQIGSLTADEWQIIGDSLPSLVAQFNIDLQGWEIPVLSDEQAAAIVDFLDANNLNTIEELQVAIESGDITMEDLPEALANLV